MPRPVTPPVAADAIIELIDRPRLPDGYYPIVLIERRHEPLGWAIPGGFMEFGETVEQTAIREALEETSLHVALGPLLGCYSDPRRDPRGQTVGLVFIATAAGEPVARDDARAFMIADAARPPPLAFDHARILADYCRWREQKSRG